MPAGSYPAVRTKRLQRGSGEQDKLNMIVLVVISALMPFVKSSNKDLMIAILVFLFGIIEYINYYWYRLSYGKSGFNIRILLMQNYKNEA